MHPPAVGAIKAQAIGFGQNGLQSSGALLRTKTNSLI